MRRFAFALALLLAVADGAQAAQFTAEVGEKALNDLAAPGCTVAASDTVCLVAGASTAQGFYRHVQVQNVSASASIACRWGGTAALNTLTSFQLAAGQGALWGPMTAGVPLAALHCIASAGSTPLYVESN